MTKSSIRWGCVLMLTLPTLGAGQSLRLTDAAGRERRCQLAEKPKRVPAVSGLVDSVALVRQLTEAGLADTLLLSLVFNQEGQLASVRPIETTSIPAGTEEAIRSGLRPQNTPGPWAIRLRIAPNPAVSIQLERSVYCPAVPADAEAGTGTAAVGRVEVRSGDRLPRPGGEVRIDAEVALDADGRPANVSLRRGSGIRELDDEIVRHLQIIRYLPALIDGLPIASWYRTDGARMRF